MRDILANPNLDINDIVNNHNTGFGTGLDEDIENIWHPDEDERARSERARETLNAFDVLTSSDTWNGFLDENS